VDANERSNRAFLTEVDANIYKSGCEWFQNIQKRMRTVFGEGAGHRCCAHAAFFKYYGALFDRYCVGPTTLVSQEDL